MKFVKFAVLGLFVCSMSFAAGLDEQTVTLTVGQLQQLLAQVKQSQGPAPKRIVDISCSCHKYQDQKKLVTMFGVASVIGERTVTYSDGSTDPSSVNFDISESDCNDWQHSPSCQKSNAETDISAGIIVNLSVNNKGSAVSTSVDGNVPAVSKGGAAPAQ